MYAIKRKNIFNSKDINNRDASIESIKDWWRKNLLDVPNDRWEIGHLDPTIEIIQGNIAYQPPIQGRYRNRFKWDALFHKYYTENEQRQIYEALKKRFEKASESASQ